MTETFPYGLDAVGWERYCEAGDELAATNADEEDETDAEEA